MKSLKTLLVTMIPVVGFVACTPAPAADWTSELRCTENQYKQMLSDPKFNYEPVIHNTDGMFFEIESHRIPKQKSTVFQSVILLSKEYAEPTAGVGHMIFEVQGDFYRFLEVNIFTCHNKLVESDKSVGNWQQITEGSPISIMAKKVQGKPKLSGTKL